jgi:hypothetical protein
MKICRFLSIDDAKKYVLRETSMFSLTSANFYKDLDPKIFGGIHDAKENEMSCEISDKTYSMTTNDNLISCWTILRDELPLSEDWDIFPEKRGIALVSSVQRVSDFLSESFKYLIEKDILRDFIHREIVYYKDGEKPKNFDIKKDSINLCFYKTLDYKKQREYRFAFRLSSCLNMAQLINYVSLRDHVESILIYPRICKNDFLKIQHSLIRAELVNMVSNFWSIHDRVKRKK